MNEIIAMEKEKLKESLLINLKSVIQSSKLGIALKNLQNEYRQFIGTTIPFEALSYKSLEDFIQDVPHALRLTTNPDGQLFVRAVTDSSTAHLANLISKQKNAKHSKPSLKFNKRRPSFNVNSTASGCSSTSNETSNEKDRIINRLTLKIEKEKKIHRDFVAQITRLNSLIKIGQESLSAERETVKNLAAELETQKAGSTKGAPDVKTFELEKVIENLTLKLEREKKINKDFSTQMVRLNCLVKIGQDSLTREQETVKRLKEELENLKAESKKRKSDIEILQLEKENKTLKNQLQEVKKGSTLQSTLISFMLPLVEPYHIINKPKVLQNMKKLGIQYEKVLPDHATPDRSSQASMDSLNSLTETQADSKIEHLESQKISENNTCQQAQELRNEVKELKTQLQKQVQDLQKRFQSQLQKLSNEVQKQSKPAEIDINAVVKMLVEHLQQKLQRGAVEHSFLNFAARGSEPSEKNDVAPEHVKITPKKSASVTTKYTSPGITAMTAPKKNKRKKKKKVTVQIATVTDAVRYSMG